MHTLCFYIFLHNSQIIKNTVEVSEVVESENSEVECAVVNKLKEENSRLRLALQVRSFEVLFNFYVLKHSLPIIICIKMYSILFSLYIAKRWKLSKTKHGFFKSKQIFRKSFGRKRETDSFLLDKRSSSIIKEGKNERVGYRNNN